MELLVVIAVIGILATVVLASLGSARLSAKDAGVSSDLSNYRTQAEIDYPEGNYTGLCASGEFSEIEEYVQSQGGAIEECDADTSGYRVIASLPSALTYNNNITYAQECEEGSEECEEESSSNSDRGYCINSKGYSNNVSLQSVNQLISPDCSLDNLTGTYYYNCAEGICYKTNVNPQQAVADAYCEAVGQVTSPCGI